MSQHQTIRVIGFPLQCGEIGCTELAAVMLRQCNQDDSVDTIGYCRRHWQLVVDGEQIGGNGAVPDGPQGRKAVML